MTLTVGQELLLDFVKAFHQGQERKYGEGEYWTHPLEVAEKVAPYFPSNTMVVEIALCHDLIEDTGCTLDILGIYLNAIGYTNTETTIILAGVDALTDKFTHEAFPNINRKGRKELEAVRLGDVSHECQSIKCCDMIVNLVSITKNDRGFARTYVKEKALIASKLDNAHPVLLEELNDVITWSENLLNQTTES